MPARPVLKPARSRVILLLASSCMLSACGDTWDRASLWSQGREEQAVSGMRRPPVMNAQSPQALPSAIPAAIPAAAPSQAAQQAGARQPIVLKKPTAYDQYNEDGSSKESGWGDNPVYQFGEKIGGWFGGESAPAQPPAEVAKSPAPVPAAAAQPLPLAPLGSQGEPKLLAHASSRSASGYPDLTEVPPTPEPLLRARKDHPDIQKEMNRAQQESALKSEALKEAAAQESPSTATSMPAYAEAESQSASRPLEPIVLREPPPAPVEPAPVELAQRPAADEPAALPALSAPTATAETPLSSLPPLKPSMPRAVPADQVMEKTEIMPIPEPASVPAPAIITESAPAAASATPPEQSVKKAEAEPTQAFESVPAPEQDPIALNAPTQPVVRTLPQSRYGARQAALAKRRGSH